MKKSRRLISIAAALVLGLCIHASSAWAEGGAPEKVIKDFTRAYFMLNPSMAAYLSEDAKTDENEADTVERYLDTKAAEARDRGYQLSYLQMRPVVMRTHVLNMDDASAEVQVEVVTLRSINPVFRIVGFVFGLLDEYEIQDTITVVKQDGEWKIGPGAFELPI